MQTLSFGARFGFAFVAFFRVLFDGAFAARALAVKDAMPALPEPKASPARDPAFPAKAERARGALMLLQMLQREGRLVDFAEQDIESFADAEIGVVARLVHDGCRKVLRAHVGPTAIRTEPEGERVSDVLTGSDVKLVGAVSGAGPFSGTLRHKGWRAEAIDLPEPTNAYDAHVLAPAEIEL